MGRNQESLTPADEMKVLLAHNFYRSGSPSGEDAVYRSERNLLETTADVISYERHNDDIDVSTITDKLRLVVETGWSRKVYEELSTIIRKAQPDIAHFHNTFPQISPSAYAACRDNNVPVVQTLHNFRFICPGGLLLRDGRPCEDCIGTNLFPALRYRCYRNSLPETAAVVWMLAKNRWDRTYQTLVNRYIALTEFASSRLIAGGLPRERIVVKPNFVADIPMPGDGKGGYAVYVGRLSVEKGLRTVMSAWKHLPEVPLKILGEGPLRQELEQAIARDNLPVDYLGFCDRTTIVDLVGRAAFQIVPSEWYEGFPMVIVDAFACGTPVVSSRIGSLDEIVEEGITGMKFEPRNPVDLANKVRALWADPARQISLRSTTREIFDTHFSGVKNHEALMKIYEAAINDHLGTIRE
ncbi:MAG: glycosyltransferase [Nitrospirota bacterium]